VLVRVRLLVIDEIGYLPLEGADATFLFEVINKRYQAEKSVILTSNKSFGQWDEIFPDSALAIALLDRLLHQATTLNIRGESYRLRHRRNAGLAVPPTERSPS
jgi:DNA replication protein DnaC